MIINTQREALRTAVADMRIARDHALAGRTHHAVAQLTYGVNHAMDARLSTEQWEQVLDLEHRYPELSVLYCRVY